MLARRYLCTLLHAGCTTLMGLAWGCGGSSQIAAIAPVGDPAQTWYVATTGSDSNPGTQSRPFLTISKGVTLLNAGGTLYVMSGVYHETVAVYISGTDTSPINILAYPGQSPIIDGGGDLPATVNGSLLELAANYIYVSGFEVRNTNSSLRSNAGVVVLGNHDTLSSMNVHHAYSTGVLIAGDYDVVEYSSIWDNAYANCRATGCPSSNYQNGGWGTGVAAGGKAVHRTSLNAILRHNTIYNNWGEGLVTGEANGTIMEDNVSYDNWATNIYVLDASNVLVQRNLAYITPGNPVGVSEKCIQMADEDASFTPRSANNTIVNNMCLNGAFYAYEWTGVPGSGLVNDLIADNTIINGWIQTGGPSNSPNPVINSNSRIVNNIVVYSSKIAGANAYSATIASIPAVDGLTFINNLWSIAAPSNAMSAKDVLGDPQLLATGAIAPGRLTSTYFELSAGSPAAGAGYNLAPSITTDAFGQTRHATPTIGAYEMP